MKQFFVFVRKEFYHVFRDRRTLFILFGMPVVQVLLFGFALTNEVKDSPVIVIDNAKDEASQAIIGRMYASHYFDIEKAPLSHNEILANFRDGKIKAAIIFPANFNADLLHTNQAQIQVITDASDPNTATTVLNYATSVIKSYQEELAQDSTIPYRISTEVRNIFNPQLKSEHNFVPGVMAMVLMLICVMMTAISIVREKEFGTMEILLVSPFKPILVVFAKLFPYLALSMVNLVTILMMSVFVLGLPIQGHVLLLVLLSMLFMMCCLSLGLLISNIAKSQQVAMLISLVGMLMPTMIFSGFMFPIENMPELLQVISNIVPSKWYYTIVKFVMIKGLGFSSIWKETLILATMTLVLFFIALRKFKIRLE